MTPSLRSCDLLSQSYLNGAMSESGLYEKIFMDEKTQSSAISESRVTTELLRDGFSVFSQISGKEPFDIAAYRDGVFLRVQVKSTRVRSENGLSFSVQLKSVRHNKTKNTIKQFDARLCDVLAVYISELDKVCFIPAKEVDGMTAIRIKEGKPDKRLRFGTDTHNTLDECDNW